MPETLTETPTETPTETTSATTVTSRAAALLRRPRAMLVVLLVIAAVVGAVWWTQRGLPGDVAVRVGETDVSVSELRERMATVEALYGVTVPDGDQEGAFWRDAAHSVAVGLVLADAAVDEDVTIAGNQVDASLQQVITSFFGEGAEGRSAFAEALADAGTSEQAVRDELRRQLEINALFADVTGDVVSPDDVAVAAAYEQRRCALVLPEKRRLRNIVVASEADAEDALRRIRGGESFGAVVSALSIDASTRDSAGDLGLVARDELEADYAAAAFGTGKGELYGPVRSEFGWNVGRVDAIRAGRVPSLEETRDQLRQTLFSEAQSRIWRDWLGKELKAADVRYADDYTPEDPLALPADGVGGALPGAADSAATDC